MRISERVDYGIRAMAELAAADGSGLMKAEEIARRQGIPLKFLLDILRELRVSRLVHSKRGPDGGYCLARPPAEVSLAAILRALDGPLADVHDAKLSELSYPPPAAALAEVWMAVRASLRQVLETVTLDDLAGGVLPPSISDLVAAYRAENAERYGT